MTSGELTSTYPGATLSEGARADARRKIVSALRACALGGILLLTVTLQLRAGAYSAELAHYSDEAAHLMNGLLIRDYIQDGLGQNPFEYAEAYYLNYPKIAPGMWPPLFHVVLGLLLLLGGHPQVTALMLVASMTAWTAWRLWRITERFAGMVVSTAVTGLFMLTPMVLDFSSVVMLDAAIATMGLEATYWFAEYAASRRTRDAVLFGVFAAGSCLTKGNGLAILLVPIIFMLLTGQFDMLRRRGLYYSALIVVVFAMPAVLYSYRLDAAIGDFGPVTLAIAWERSLVYGAHLWRQLTTVTVVFAILGAAMSLSPIARRSRRDQRTLPTALTAFVVAFLIFHIFNPHTTIAVRYVMAVIAPLLGLSALGVSGIMRLGRTRQSMRLLQVSALVLMTAVSIDTRPAPIRYPVTSWRSVTATLSEAGMLAGRRILIISDERGEGALIADVAMTAPQPRATMVRGSKLLATDNWNGYGLELHYTTPGALMQEIEDLHIRYIVLDRGAAAQRLPFYELVSRLVSQETERLERVPFQEGGTIALYRVRRQSAGEPKKLTVRVSSTGQQIAER